MSLLLTIVCNSIILYFNYVFIFDMCLSDKYNINLKNHITIFKTYYVLCIIVRIFLDYFYFNVDICKQNIC